MKTKEKAKLLLKSIPVLSAITISLRKIIRPTAHEYLERLVHKIGIRTPHPVFVKVGANDGLTGDLFGDSFLRHRCWNGLLIEPVPYCVAKLREIYSDPLRFAIAQVAVGKISGHADFYYISEAAKDSIPDLPNWFDQLGSFNREHILKHLDGKLEPFIVVEKVRVETLANLLEEHAINTITILHVDAEGYDLEVLKSLGLPAVCPLWIVVEHIHLSLLEKCELVTILTSCGYQILDVGSDFLAIHRNTDEQLRPNNRMGKVVDPATYHFGTA